MTHHTQTAPARTPTDRLIAALQDPNRLFTPVEMVYLMATAGRWGYEARAGEDSPADPLSQVACWQAGYDQRVAEEEADWPDPAVFDAAAVEVARAVLAARSAADADRTQRYAGGPVPVWDADRPDLDDLGPSARSWSPRAGIPIVRSGAGWAWRGEA